MSRNVRKRTFEHVRSAQTQISLEFAQSDQLSLCAFWIAKDPGFLQVVSKDSDQTARTRRLIWVFADRTCSTVRYLLFRISYCPPFNTGLRIKPLSPGTRKFGYVIYFLNRQLIRLLAIICTWSPIIDSLCYTQLSKKRWHCNIFVYI